MLKHLTIVLGWWALGLLVSGSSEAALGQGVVALRQVQVSNGDQVDFLFDREIDPKQIKIEYLRDNVQLSINNVSVYPPKIFSVDGSDLTKVFTYQYMPNLVRARLSVKQPAEAYKHHLSARMKGRVLSLKFTSPGTTKDQLTVASAQSVKAAPPSSLPPSDKTLLDKVLKSVPSSASPTLTGDVAHHSMQRLTGSKTPLTGQRPTVGIFKALGFSVFLFSFVAVGFLLWRKKGQSKKGEPQQGWLRRMMRSKLGGGKMIEVVSSQYLGPKKSIAVVKIQGQLFVLGVTDESINLITQLQDDENLELEAVIPSASKGISHTIGTGAVSAGTPVFSSLLAQEQSRPSMHPIESPRRSSAIRDQIKKRTEGLKTL